VGAGVTALQTAANPYVAILGPESSAPVRLTLAQALNSLGGTIAPIVAGAYILTDPAKLQSKAAVANTVRGPYIAIAGGLLILGITTAFLHLPHVTQTQEFRPAGEGDAILDRSIWSYRHTVLAAVGIFLYVGVEVGLASIAPNYFKNQGIDSLSKASFLVSLYWGGALIGRLLGSWILTRIKSGLLLGIFGFAATAFVFISMATHGSPAIWAVVICGFFNSIMFPNIFALGIAGLGPLTSKGSGLIMTAVVGGAVVPLLIGLVADKTGSIQTALIIPAICYLFIAYYGLWGSKPKRIVQA
jgi:FHS family L-fucose permease-like MFS transporter